MSVAEGITAIKATVELARLTSALLKGPSIDPAKVQGNLHELLIHAVNAQLALAEALQELQGLRSRLDDMVALDALKADLEPVSDGGFLMKKSERGKGQFVPYCPVCWGQQEKAVALVPRANGYYSCAIHEAASYKTQAYRGAEQQRIAAEQARSKATEIRGPNAWMAR